MIEALDLPPSFDVHAGERLHRNGPLMVEFRNISYAYGEAGSPSHKVLHDFNLTIREGEKVALIGPSGAGKTTVMKLLLRFDDPCKGNIRINRKPLKRLLLKSYMEQIGYIPQQAMIFDSTLGENVLYGASKDERCTLTENSHEKLWDLMRSLKIDFGTRLSNGLDTLVGRHGLKLSGGQAQRVMIGAAVAKKPRLMVIDEATSNLDSTTEKEVQEGLSKALEGGVTALIVAHRLSTVRNLCTRFVVLKPIETLSAGERQIEAVAGSFEELYAISPTFRQLADDQGVKI
jgi:ATP-binding cassette subfamily B protein